MLSNLPAPPEKPPLPGGVPGHRAPRKWLIAPWLATLLLLVLAGAWFWREPLRHRLAWWGVLANDVPTPDLVETLIRQAPPTPAHRPASRVANG